MSIVKRFTNLFTAKKESKKSVKRAHLVALNNGILSKLFSVSAGKYVKHMSDTEIDVMMRDLTFSQANESRKAASEKKEIQIVCENEKLKTQIEKLFDSDTISQVLDTHVFGFNVFEINWEEKDGLLIPSFVQRDYRDFTLNEEKKLFYGIDEVPEYKAIYTLFKPRFNKPYGDALLDKIYFPIKIKNASVEFWVRFLERFGSPWALGKTDREHEEMAEEIHAMLAGDCAVIDPEDDLSLIQPSSSSSNNSFSPIIDYCDKQITKAILGGNLTAEVSGGSFAAAQTHNDIREDLAAADAKILENFINQAIKMFCEINGITEDIWAQLYNEGDPKIELAARDKTIFDMGYKPTKKYIEDTYNIEVDEYDPNEFREDLYKDVKIENKGLLKGILRVLKSPLNAKLPLTKIDAGIRELKLENKNLSETLLKVLEECNSYEEAYDILLNKYEGEEFDTLEDELTNAIANSALMGA